MITVQHYHNNINIEEVGKTILRYLILSILPSPSSNNTYEDKTQNKCNLDTVKNHIHKSLFSKVSRVTTTVKVQHKTTNASRFHTMYKTKEKGSVLSV